MEAVNPFQAPGRWYRGNTHSHSTVSDGRVTVAERFAGYREAGYDFLVLTDHHRISDVSAFSDDSFLAISGSELHPPNPYGGERYHIVAINLRETVDAGSLHPNQVLEEIGAQGGAAVLCHPYWCGHTLDDLAPLRGYIAVEVYDETCMQLIGKGYSEPHWDDLLDRVGPCWGIAADDAHDAIRDCYRAWIMVKAPDLSLESMLKSLRAGSFYSTQGPEIRDLRLHRVETELPDGRRQVLSRVVVECSEAISIDFKAQRSRGRRVSRADARVLTAAEYVVRPGDRYVRVEITDAQGRKAWTNPVLV